jgi:sec-independent protein translocase protein TatA
MLAVGIGDLGLPELLVILVVVILLFGSAKLGDVGGALGKSVREFRHAAHEGEALPDTTSAVTSATDAVQTAAATYCTNCGEQLSKAAKYCARCGAGTISHQLS